MEMTKQPAAARRVRLPKPGRIVINVVLIVCSLIWIYPIIWTIISSFKPQADFFKEQLSLFPATWTLDNYVRVWSKANFAVYFFNSVVVTVFSVLLVLIMTNMAGYVLGRYKFVGRGVLMAVFLSSICIPLVSTLIPVYQIVTLPVAVSFSNTPAYYIDKAPKVSISPSTIHVAVDPDKLDGMKRISIGTIDFSEVESGTTNLTLKASDMTEGIPMDSSAEFDVTINTGNLSTRTIEISKPSIKVTNNATDLTVRPSAEPMTVTLIGPEEDLAALTASSITFTADLTGRNIEEGIVRLALTPSVSSETCWCYGSYTCRATIQ